MIRHNQHCATFEPTPSDCTCGATRRAQRKGAPSMSRSFDVLQVAIREELKVLRMCSVEAAVSLSLDKAAIKASIARLEESLVTFEHEIFDRPELPLAGR